MIINLILQLWQSLTPLLRICAIVLIIFMFHISSKIEDISLELNIHLFDLWGLTITYITYYVTQKLLITSHNMDVVIVIYKIFLIIDLIILFIIFIKTTYEVGIFYAFPTLILKLFAIIIPGVLFACITWISLLVFFLIFFFGLLISLLF